MLSLEHLAACVQVLMYVGCVVVAFSLIRVDVMEHRLPNRIVVPAGAVLIALMIVHAAFALDAVPLVRGVLGGVALGALYALLRTATRGGVGGGDVKLAVVVGCFLAWHGWIAFVVGAAAAFVFAGGFAIVRIAARRMTGSTQLAFGPWMLVGATAALVVA